MTDAIRYAWARFFTWMEDARPRLPDMVPVALLCATLRQDGDDVELDLAHGARILWPEDFLPEDRVRFLEAIAWAYAPRRPHS